MGIGCKCGYRTSLAGAVSCFLVGEPASGGSLMSTGDGLYSYGVRIGYWMDGKVVMSDALCVRSRTTSRHRNLLRQMVVAKGISLIEDK